MASEKICAICNTKNTFTAFVCSSCGALLEENPTNLVAINEAISGQPSAPVEDVTAFLDVAMIPEGGVGIHVAGAPKPFYISIYKELILGRQTDATLEAVLDLSDLDAFNMGISRRHAIIRRVGTGFEVLDLGSRNGTWLNAEQLIPHKPYPFASGSQLRLGRMRLFIVYQVGGLGVPK